MTRAYRVADVERKWRAAWDRAGCFRAPAHPSGTKFFNYDSGPFPNGPLHLGHVRTYVLGDVTARYQRLLGRCVLYATEWDAFGLPNEIAALRAGVAPGEFTARNIETMRRQMRRLGLSYDWSRVRSTASPAYCRGTQWLFLELLERGLVERRDAELSFCPGCATALAAMQVEADACARCGAAVEMRRLTQWYVLVSRFGPRLRESLAQLDGFAPRVREMLGATLDAGHALAGARSSRVHDWLVSRQRAWGTPIPIVHCAACGPVPVPRDALPVLLPEDLDWTCATPLASHAAFLATPCPRCAAPARRETDTLDCFFDDVWCILACLAVPGREFEPAGLDAMRAWLPVDRFHAGWDTLTYLHLHRFLGAVLRDAGMLDDAEPIRSYLGHDMVLAGGRKMSKHLGNAVSPDALIRAHGADALRLAVLWAAGPQRAMRWNGTFVERTAVFLDSAHLLVERCVAAGVLKAAESESPSSAAARALDSAARASIVRVGQFIDDYRPHAALDELNRLLGRIRQFAERRITSARLLPGDRPLLSAALGDFALGIAPFAPHLAEELWARLGRAPLVAQASWPTR